MSGTELPRGTPLSAHAQTRPGSSTPQPSGWLPAAPGAWMERRLSTGPGPGGGSGSPEKQRQVDQVCGALGARVGCRAHVCLGELCAQGGPPVSYHLETITYDTRAPLWSL